MFLASGRSGLLDGPLVVYLVSILQWINLGVTVAKFGLDVYIYAAVTKDASLVFDLKSFSIRYTVPASLGVALIALFMFDSETAVACFIGTLFEALSIILIAEQTARTEFVASAVSSFLRFPVFMLGLCVWNSFARPERYSILILLTATSVARFVFAAQSRVRPQGLVRLVRYSVSLRSCTLYPLNFLIFKIDQLLLPFVSKHGSLLAAQYTFVSRWPDALSGLGAAIGAAVFPHSFVGRDESWCTWIKRTLRGRWPIAIMVTVGIIGATELYCQLWKGEPIPHWLIVAFVFQALLIFPANLAAYSLLREQCLSGLLLRFVCSSLLGFVLIGCAFGLGKLHLIALVVPIQLSIVIVSLFALSWGQPGPIYELVQEEKH
jgi:hypothetical protein